MTPGTVVRRVGFVGLGRMGWPMARNLARAGFELTVRDADGERQERFAAEFGSEQAWSPDGFASSQLVLTMLPDDRDVRSALVDWEGGIAPALAPSTLVVDMSSSSPIATRALAVELAERRLELVDAPVSGGVPRAEDGTLSIMVGGNEGAIARAEPVLLALGSRIFRTGSSGSGHAMKALNNFVAAAAYTATSEALAIGVQFGLEPAVMIEIMNSSTGRSFSSEHVFGEHVVTGRYATGFALSLLAKDVGIAASLAAETAVDAPACELVNRRWSEAAAGLEGHPDHSEAHKQWWPTSFQSAGGL